MLINNKNTRMLHLKGKQHKLFVVLKIIPNTIPILLLFPERTSAVCRVASLSQSHAPCPECYHNTGLETSHIRSHITTTSLSFQK